MVREEEKAVFVCELDKMRIEYRKCTDLLVRVQIGQDIMLLQNALTITGFGPDEYLDNR